MWLLQLVKCQSEITPFSWLSPLQRNWQYFHGKTQTPSINFLSFMVLPKRELPPEQMRQLISVSIPSLGDFWLQWTKLFQSNEKGCALTACAEIYRILPTQRHFPVEYLFLPVVFGNCENHKACTYICLCEWSVLVFCKNGKWDATLYLDYYPSQILKVRNEDAINVTA